MKYSKVSFAETFEIFLDNGRSKWQKIFCEVELDLPDDDRRKALYECKKTVESFFFESNKADEKKAEESKKPVWKEIQELNTLEDQIKSCTELKVLEGYKLIVKGKPELETAYNNRLKELT